MCAIALARSQPRRRSITLRVPIVLAVAFGATTMPARAQLKGLEIVAPANPGSGFDQTSRTVRDVLAEAGLASGTQVINVPGAGGLVGLAQFVATPKRNPAMLTIGVTTVGSELTTKSAVTLDAAAPLALLLREYSVVVVPAKSDIRSMADLVERIRRDTKTVTFAVGSTGGIDHVLAGLIVKAVGADPKAMNAINYAGGGKQLVAVLSGRVTAGIGGAPEFASQIASGRMRALAVSSPERLEGLDVPTLREAGVEVTFGTWRGLMIQKDADPETKAAMADAIARMVATPAWKAALKQRGWTESYRPAEGFAAFLAEQKALMRTSLTDLGLVK